MELIGARAKGGSIARESPSARRALTRKTRAVWATLLCSAALLAAPRFAAAGPFTQNGHQPPLTYPMQTPNSCRGCHGGYDASNNIEAWDTWAGSMMANATRDPIFWAALDVANNDVPNIGDYCLRCHTPSGWLAGRSEAPGGSPDGCGLVGMMDVVSGTGANDFEGVTCHLCHRMTSNATPPPGEDTLYFENAQYWIDDTDCDGYGEPCRRGPYDYPPDTPPNHAWAFSPYHEGSSLCGTCHNVTSPSETLIVGGASTGVPFPIERTFAEWQQSAYADSQSPGFRTCQNCHMPDAMQDTVYACILPNNNRSGDMPAHEFAGGNAWIPDVLRQEYPALNRSNQFNATKAWALDMLQNQSATVNVTVPAGVLEGDTLDAEVRVTNLTGHKLPTGYPEGRRMWLSVEARDGLGNVVWRSGAYDSTTGVLTHDAQLKLYRAELGIWNHNGTNTCDCEDELGDPMFHFVLNNCYVIDNRIPPLGFTGGSNLETQPKGYVYPETSPGSGVLVNYDVTSYAIPVPIGAASPITVTATLRYQTTSKEYVEFVRDEAVENSFPDDCIPRSTGSPAQSRGELLYDMWAEYNRCPPVSMATDARSASVNSAVGVPADALPSVIALAAASAPNEAAQRIVYDLPATARVTLDVYDVAGRRVARLIDGTRPPGRHVGTWDASRQPSGVYIYRLAAGSEIRTRKVLVLR